MKLVFNFIPAPFIPIFKFQVLCYFENYIIALKIKLTFAKATNKTFTTSLNSLLSVCKEIRNLVKKKLFYFILH